MRLTEKYPAATYGKPLFYAYLEFLGPNHSNVSGKSNKFWECIVINNGLDYIVIRRWGKFGTKGQTSTQRFASQFDAALVGPDLCRRKREEGYTDEVDIVTRLGATL